MTQPSTNEPGKKRPGMKTILENWEMKHKKQEMVQMAKLALGKNIVPKTTVHQGRGQPGGRFDGPSGDRFGQSERGRDPSESRDRSIGSVDRGEISATGVSDTTATHTATPKANYKRRSPAELGNEPPSDHDRSQGRLQDEDRERERYTKRTVPIPPPPPPKKSGMRPCIIASVIVFIVLIIVGAVMTVAVMFLMGVGPFETTKRPSPTTQQSAIPEDHVTTSVEHGVSGSAETSSSTMFSTNVSTATTTSTMTTSTTTPTTTETTTTTTTSTTTTPTTTETTTTTSTTTSPTTTTSTTTATTSTSTTTETTTTSIPSSSDATSSMGTTSADLNQNP